jgi:hypothetical protein
MSSKKPSETLTRIQNRGGQHVTDNGYETGARFGPTSYTVWCRVDDLSYEDLPNDGLEDEQTEDNCEDGTSK